ncbi:MAG: [Bacteroidales bacterium]|nr:[FeFe] hydrogenase H-cluster maturation GTPase HydF [Bacteroidales bacterium]
MSSTGNELKPRIGIFGRRNCGKSTLLNDLTGQPSSIVSHVPGTTTDAVRRSIELLGIGPVVLIDTPGFDDYGTLGSQRSASAFATIDEVDLAILLFSRNLFSDIETDFIRRCQQAATPLLLIYSLSDAFPPNPHLLHDISDRFALPVQRYSHTDATLLQPIIDSITLSIPASAYRQPNIMSGLVSQGDTAVLVCPIDSEAPAGRLILPQVQVLRALLDLNASAVVCQPDQLPSSLQNLATPPRLVITDSQAFRTVAPLVPDSIFLTSFSILLARAKGPFRYYLDSISAIDRLAPGCRILMLESCTHTSNCDDIGRVKLPRLLQQHVGGPLHFEFLAAQSPLPDDLASYALVIQCGGCVATPKLINARLAHVISAHIPATNYGLALAHLSGILPRATQIFRHAKFSRTFPSSD